MAKERGPVFTSIPPCGLILFVETIFSLDLIGIILSPYSKVYSVPSSEKKNTQAHFILSSNGPQLATSVVWHGISTPSEVIKRK